MTSLQKRTPSNVYFSPDGKTMTEVYYKQFSFTIPWSIIIVAILAIIAFLFTKHFTSSDSQNNTANDVANQSIIEANISVSDDIVFDFSSSRLINESDIAKLLSNDENSLFLVQKAINEIYARNGYLFKEQKWFNYYSAFSWYNGTLDGSRTYAQFNDIEKKNVNYLVSIREELKK